MRISLTSEYQIAWVAEGDAQLENKVKHLRSFFAKSLEHDTLCGESYLLENGGRIRVGPIAGDGNVAWCRIWCTIPTVDSARETLCYERAMEEFLRDKADRYEEDLPEDEDGYLRILKCSQYGPQTAWSGSTERYELPHNPEDRHARNALNVLSLAMGSGLFIGEKILGHVGGHRTREKLRNSVHRQWTRIVDGINRRTSIRRIEEQLQAFVDSRAAFCADKPAPTIQDSNLREPSTAVPHVTVRPMSPSEISRGIGTLVNQRGLRGLLDFWRRQLCEPLWVEVTNGPANRCQVGELLRFGATGMVIEMLAGRSNLDDNALASVNGKRHHHAQRSYLKQVTSWMKSCPIVSTDKHEVIQLWNHVLELLDVDGQRAMFGQLDWITKNYLAQMCCDLDTDNQMEVEVGYHDIREGPFWLIDHEGMVAILVEHDEVIEAVVEPPRKKPMALRSATIKSIVEKTHSLAALAEVSPRTSLHQRQMGRVISLFD